MLSRIATTTPAAIAAAALTAGFPADSVSAQRVAVSRDPRAIAVAPGQEEADRSEAGRTGPIPGECHAAQHDEEGARHERDVPGLAQEANGEERGQKRRGRQDDVGTRRPNPVDGSNIEQLGDTGDDESDDEEWPQLGRIEVIGGRSCGEGDEHGGQERRGVDRYGGGAQVGRTP